ncbi:MAG TPA: LysM peptidoglycan-binding domain-containing protein, partial [Gracilimonas sp.]|uniref:LysM peptidoglycan-binding domain-containing protein n=1 Tax=Gracilimonas sp. TaxID=1974203 RepID=UPI002D825D6B|nr:LysM peptidoglycan-binding domain-containing protein [Gracilimonas sp.]
MNKRISLLKKIMGFAFLLLFFFSIDVFAQERSTYEVKQGDTLYGISKKLNVTIPELQEWNNLTGSEIELGQQLVYYITQKDSASENIPDEPSDPLINSSSNTQNVFYTVKSGDTLYRIARDHNMTLDQLKSLNNLTSDNISVGQRLSVRKSAEAPPSVTPFSEESSPQGMFSVYEVKRGESVTAIITRFKMTEEEFKKLNPELNTNRLTAGQEVTVLLPPSRNYKNPYLQRANLQDLGVVQVMHYDASEVGETT